MTKSLLKIAFLSVNLLILIVNQYSIIGLPFPQALIVMKLLVLPDLIFLKVNVANTKKNGNQ